MSNPSKSFLNLKAIGHKVPIDEISNSPHAITIYKETIEAILNLLYDPENNPAEEYTSDFLNNVLRKDLARISKELRDYNKEKPSRNEIYLAKEFLDTAESQMSVVAKHLKKENSSVQEEFERIDMLKKCRNNLEEAKQYFGLFLFIPTIYLYI